jgi:hypothetical protein
MPELFHAVDEIASSWDTPQKEDVIQKLWYDLEPQTIDYGVMEKAEHVAVLPAGGLGWSDVGAWDSLFEVLLPDMNGNVAVNSQHLPLDEKAQPGEIFVRRERVSFMEAYCMKCKTKREMKDPVAGFNAKRSPVTIGTCPVCGTKLYRMGAPTRMKG